MRKESFFLNKKVNTFIISSSFFKWEQNKRNQTQKEHRIGSTEKKNLKWKTIQDLNEKLILKEKNKK